MKDREVVAWRQASSAVCTWKEFLCVSGIAPDIGLLEVCTYEPLGEFKCVDDPGNVIKLPKRREGKRVIGIEEGYLYGGQLTALLGERFEYRAEDVEEVIRQLEHSRFNLGEAAKFKLREALLMIK